MNDPTIHPDALGVVLDGVYDGVSVWVQPDGTAVNRWATEAPLSRRWRAADAWIRAYNLGRETERERHQ